MQRPDFPLPPALISGETRKEDFSLLSVDWSIYCWKMLNFSKYLVCRGLGVCSEAKSRCGLFLSSPAGSMSQNWLIVSVILASTSVVSMAIFIWWKLLQEVEASLYLPLFSIFSLPHMRTVTDCRQFKSIYSWCDKQNQMGSHGRFIFIFQQTTWFHFFQ